MELPNELLELVMLFLEVPDFMAVVQTCHCWKGIICSNTFIAQWFSNLQIPRKIWKKYYPCEQIIPEPKITALEVFETLRENVQMFVNHVIPEYEFLKLNLQYDIPGQSDGIFWLTEYLELGDGMSLGQLIIDQQVITQVCDIIIEDDPTYYCFKPSNYASHYAASQQIDWRKRALDMLQWFTYFFYLYAKPSAILKSTQADVMKKWITDYIWYVSKKLILTTSQQEQSDVRVVEKFIEKHYQIFDWSVPFPKLDFISTFFIEHPEIAKNADIPNLICRVQFPEKFLIECLEQTPTIFDFHQLVEDISTYQKGITESFRKEIIKIRSKKI